MFWRSNDDNLGLKLFCCRSFIYWFITVCHSCRRRCFCFLSNTLVFLFAGNLYFFVFIDMCSCVIVKICFEVYYIFFYCDDVGMSGSFLSVCKTKINFNNWMLPEHAWYYKYFLCVMPLWKVRLENKTKSDS